MAKAACLAALALYFLGAVATAQEPPPRPVDRAPSDPPAATILVPVPTEPINPPPAAILRTENVDDAMLGNGGRMGGFGGMGAFANMGPNGPAVVAINDRTFWSPNARVTGQNTSFGFVKESLGLSLPVYRDSNNTVSFNTGVGATMYTGNAFLPDTQTPFPSTVWNIHFGANYGHQFENGWQGILGMSIGSVSDKPFENWTQINIGFNAGLRIPVGERNAWLFSLAYSPLGQLGFPVPGIAFLWVPNDWLRMTIGLPFQITITPTPDWQFTASYMLLTTIHTQLSYRVAPRVRVYVGYDWGNEGFRLAEQENTRERFLYYEMKVNTGVKWTVGQFRFDVSGGYAFDRYFAQGRGPFNTQNRIAIENGPFLGISGSYRW